MELMNRRISGKPIPPWLMLVAAWAASGALPASAQLFGPKGEKWTIQCLEFQGPDHHELCERVAEALRNTQGVEKKQILLYHEKNRSLLCYGEYYRKRDAATDDLAVPSTMAKDLKMLKELVGGDGRHLFIAARMVPYPTPDVGNPEWELSKADGDYTLQVAVFYNTDEFYERKQAAADYCADLRARGYEAFYHHGETASEVTVGAFKKDNPPRPGKEPSFTPKVNAIRRNEQLKFHLENGKFVYRIQDGRKVKVESKLMMIPQNQDAWPEGW